MIKRAICFFLALWLCTLTAVGAGMASVTGTAAEEDETVVVTVPDVAGMAVGAEAALVMEASTGKVLFAQGEKTRLPFASTTKIMTALITLEQPGLDIEFEVDSDAIQVEGSSMGLTQGDKVTLRTLAAGMLLSSGNDAANAAAVRIAGSIPAFVTMMNSRARLLGMSDTSFETPSGLDGEKHYSTAYDLALLARTALQNPEFATICSQYKMRVSYGNPPYNRWLTNHNKLLNYYDGAIGVKTGFTKKAGRCLVSGAQRDGVTLICVTLDCPDDWTTHEKLFDCFFSKVCVEDLAQRMPELTLPVTGGRTAGVKVRTSNDAVFAVPMEDCQVEYTVEHPPFLYAPVTAGQVVGQVQILLDGQVISALDLVTESEVPLLHPYVEKKSFLERLRDAWGKWTDNSQ